MRTELNKIEQIEKYLRDELSTADKKAFEEKLKTDSNLQKEVDLQRNVVKGIERIGVRKSISKASRNYDNRRRGFFFGVVLLIVISGAIGIHNYSTDEIIKKPIVTESVEIIKEEETERKESLVIDNESAAVEILTETEIETTDVVKFPTKKFQYFTINSSKDTTIIGGEGTEITFKANSFDVPKNSAVKIRLKEYYKMSDIAFSNLTTETKDGKLLETGGMLYIDALVNNKKVDLNKNTFFDLKFPFDEKKKDMILFDGKTKNKTIVWEESEVYEIVEEFIGEEVFTIVESMPEFPGGQKKLFEYLGKNIKYPIGAKVKGVSGKVYVNFTIDKVGKISNAKILRGVNPFLDREAIRVIESMPNWSPGLQRGKPTSVSYNLPIDFKLNGSTSTYTPKQIRLYNDSLIEAQNRDIESDLFQDDGVAEEKNSKEGKTAKADINYYVLSGSKLGWINCDRFAGRGNLNLAIKVENKAVNVKVIFHRIKSLIAGSNNGLYSRFGRVPTGERVTVFAVKYVDKKPFICLKEITTSNKSINLEFVELTKEGLKEVAKKISNI